MKTPLSLEHCYFNKEKNFLVVRHSALNDYNWSSNDLFVRSHVTGLQFSYNYKGNYNKDSNGNYWVWKTECQDSTCPVKTLYVLDDDVYFGVKFPNFDLKDFEP